MIHSDGSHSVTVPVEFGGVSIGDETARLGLKINRDNMPLDAVDQFLVGRRLRGKVVLGSSDPDQQALPGMEDSISAISGTFDVKRVGLSSKEISCGLTLALDEIDVSLLAGFARRVGTLLIEDCENLKVEEKPTHDDHPDVGPMPVGPTTPEPKGKGRRKAKAKE